MPYIFCHFNYMLWKPKYTEVASFFKASLMLHETHYCTTIPCIFTHENFACNPLQSYLFFTLEWSNNGKVEFDTINSFIPKRFLPNVPFWSPWNYRKTRGFIDLFRGIKREYWEERGSQKVKCKTKKRQEKTQ